MLVTGIFMLPVVPDRSIVPSYRVTPFKPSPIYLSAYLSVYPSGGLDSIRSDFGKVSRFIRSFSVLSFPPSSCSIVPFQLSVPLL